MILHFNGWGNKFESALDNQINKAVVEKLSHANNDYQALDMVLEGGGIEIKRARRIANNKRMFA